MLDAIDTVRMAIASVDDLSKNVSIRDLDASFACTVGISSDVWDRLCPNIPHYTISRRLRARDTPQSPRPGDLLFHIRAQRRDLCFDFERQLMDLLGESVTVI